MPLDKGLQPGPLKVMLTSFLRVSSATILVSCTTFLWSEFPPSWKFPQWKSHPWCKHLFHQGFLFYKMSFILSKKCQIWPKRFALTWSWSKIKWGHPSLVHFDYICSILSNATVAQNSFHCIWSCFSHLSNNFSSIGAERTFPSKKQFKKLALYIYIHMFFFTSLFHLPIRAGFQLWPAWDAMSNLRFTPPADLKESLHTWLVFLPPFFADPSQLLWSTVDAIFECCLAFAVRALYRRALPPHHVGLVPSPALSWHPCCVDALLRHEGFQGCLITAFQEVDAAFLALDVMRPNTPEMLTFLPFFSLICQNCC